MNKGLDIRNSKQRNKAKKCHEIKEEQENICRFVVITYQVIERINGKYRRTGEITVKGLQIKNRVYLTDGGYKLINGKGVRIKKHFDTIPEWATDELIKKHEQFLNN